MQSSKVTERINAKAFELLEQHPEGLRFSELRSRIEASDHNFHPKTVNGCVWKLVQRFPDKVYKPSKGLFRLLKYESAEVETTPVIRTVELPNQVRLPYVEQGDSSGVPLILLHGYADSWHSFERVLPYLPESIRAFILTQRGHGDASRPEGGYRLSDFTADLLAFMDTIHLDTAVIAGGSSGGIVARCFAIDYPQRSLGLVLIGSPLSLRDKPGVLEVWDSTISKLEDPIDPKFVREFIESTFTQPVPQAFLETLVRESLKVPAHVWKETFIGFLEDNSSEKLDKIKAPTLIVWGDHDTVIPKSDQETFVDKITDSRFVVYPGAGHALYCEEPERLASDLVAFIKDITR